MESLRPAVPVKRFHLSPRTRLAVTRIDGGVVMTYTGLEYGQGALRGIRRPPDDPLADFRGPGDRRPGRLAGGQGEHRAGTPGARPGRVAQLAAPAEPGRQPEDDRAHQRRQGLRGRRRGGVGEIARTLELAHVLGSGVADCRERQGVPGHLGRRGAAEVRPPPQPRPGRRPLARRRRVRDGRHDLPLRRDHRRVVAGERLPRLLGQGRRALPPPDGPAVEDEAAGGTIARLGGQGPRGG